MLFLLLIASVTAQTNQTTETPVAVTTLLPTVPPDNCYAPLTCSNHGTCLPLNIRSQNRTCFCDPCFTTFCTNGNCPECAYQMKSQTLIFWMTFFFNGIGVGHFIAGNNWFGVMAICFTLISTSIYKLLKHYKNSSNKPHLLLLIMAPLILLMPIYWIISLINYGVPNWTDGSGVPLCGW